MPFGEGLRHLHDFVDVRVFKGRPHLPPALEKSRVEAPPGSSFPRKLLAFLRNQVFGWLFSYIKFRFGTRHRFQTYDGSGDTGEYRDLEGIPVGFNGVANLIFRAEFLTVEYRDISDQLLLTEVWRTQDGVLVGSRTERRLDDRKLVSVRALNDAIGGVPLRAAG